MIYAFSVRCSGMQELIDICTQVGSKLNVKFNTEETVMKRFAAIHYKCFANAKFLLNNSELEYVEQTKYLGHFCI